MKTREQTYAARKEERRRLRIGAEFLRWFPALRSTRQVAALLGCTQQNVSVLERRAAYHIVSRMKAALRERE